MGKALIIPNIDFSSANLGQVTIDGNKDLVSILISGPDSVRAYNTAQYSVVYNPTDTTAAQRGVTWSVISGDATIDSTGLLTAAGAGSVVIRATSTYDSSIYAESSVTVGDEPLENLTARINNGGNGFWKTDIVPAQGDVIKVKFAVHVAGNNTVMGSRTAANSDNDSILLDFNSYQMQSAVMKAAMFGTIYASENTFEVNTPYVAEMSASGASITPSLGTVTQWKTYSYSSGVALAVGCMRYSNDNVGTRGNIDFYGLEIRNNGILTHRLIPQQDLSLYDEVTEKSYQIEGTGVYEDD